MMQRSILNILWGIVTILTLVSACRPASWEFVSKKKNGDVPASPITGPIPGPTVAPTPTDAPKPDAPEDPFTAKATPNPSPMGAPIVFTGRCGKGNKGKITWTMGNGDSREGSEFSYSYSRVGSYSIVVKCEEGGSVPKTVTINVDITPLIPITPGTPGGGQNGSQNPGQSKKN